MAKREKPLVRIQRISNTEYYFGASNREGAWLVRRALTFWNNNPFVRMHRIEKFSRGRMTFERGMLSTVRKAVENEGAELFLNDWEWKLDKSVRLDPRLRDYQMEAVRALFQRRYGIVQVPTRGGKTFIAAECLRIYLRSNRKDPFLFITDNVTLLRQSASDLREYFRPYGGLRVTEICGGELDLTGRVTVATVQTLQAAIRIRGSEREISVRKYLRSLGFLCIDEIHDNSSDARLKLFRMATEIKYLLCLSATPYRTETPFQNLKLQAWSGDIIYRITEERLTGVGVLSEYRVAMLTVDHSVATPILPVEDKDYRGMREAVILGSEVRNNILTDVIGSLKRMGRKTLVLFTSVTHGIEISRRTGVPFIYGGTDADEREERKREFLSGHGGVLLASDIFKKGITLPEAEVLVNADGGLEVATVIQKRGRVLGSTTEKHRALIVDFIDYGVRYFPSHSLSRLQAYIDGTGEERTLVLDALNDSYLTEFEKWVTDWFVGNVGC